MYNPISSEFFDQLTVAMERKIPSRIEYYQNEEQERKKERETTNKSFSRNDGAN
jgi:Rho-binding antiterminator